MKNTAIVLLLVFTGVLGWLVFSQAASLREQREQIHQLNAKLEAMSKATSLELQEKCAKQARGSVGKPLALAAPSSTV